MVLHEEYIAQLKRMKRSFDNFVVVHKNKLEKIPDMIIDRCIHIRQLDSDYVVLAINDEEFYELMDKL